MAAVLEAELAAEQQRAAALQAWNARLTEQLAARDAELKDTKASRARARAASARFPASRLPAAGDRPPAATSSRAGCGRLSLASSRARPPPLPQPF